MRRHPGPSRSIRRRTLNATLIAFGAISAGTVAAEPTMPTGPFDPASVVSAQFPTPVAKPLPAPTVAPPAPLISTSISAPAPAPATLPVQPPTETIKLHIDVKLDDVRAPRPVSPTVPSTDLPMPLPVAAAPTEPFDFARDSRAPAVLSIPAEGVPEKPKTVPAPPPRQIAAAQPAAPAPAPTVEAKLDARLAEPVEPAKLIERPILLGESVVLGMPQPDDATCFDRAGAKRICVFPVDWTPEMAPLFRINGSLYRGTKAVARIDDGKVEILYGLFPAENFDRIAGHFALRFGEAERLSLPMALVGDPKARNRVLRWPRIDADGKRVILELRANDDMRDILPDETYGVFRLYRENDLPLFHDLQTTDFLLHGMRSGAS